MPTKITPTGLKRHGGKLAVRVFGSWTPFNLLDDVNKEVVRQFAAFSDARDVNHPDGFKSADFSIVLDEPDDMPPQDSNEDEGTQPESKLPKPNKGDGDATEGTFELPASAKAGDAEGDGSGGGGGGDDTYMVTDAADPDDPKLVPFNEAFESRAQDLGQAVMDQTLQIVANELDDVVKGVATEMGSMEERLRELSLRNNSAQATATGDQVVVKITVTTPKEVKELDGLAHNMLPKLIRYVSMGQHCYLPGPPGSSKSHSAKQAADALDRMFGSISLGPLTPESRFWGGMDAHGVFHDTSFTECIRYAANNLHSGSVYVIDEMDNGNGGNIATLNSVLANGWVTLPNGETLTIGSNFTVIACANTFGTGPTAQFSGRNRLDAATLDRFAYLPWETDLGLERQLVVAHLKDARLAADWLNVWRATRERVTGHGLNIFVTMRGAVNGAKLISAGDTIGEAWMAVLGDKIPDEQRVKVNPL